jgi:LVIVD repeat
VLPGVFPGGWEGLHVFDISDLSDPDLVASVETECGSHTATAVPDPANSRLLVYNNPSSAACPGIDIVEVPLDDPSSASYLRFEPAGRSCHDTGVILGDAMQAACAGGNGFTTWSLDPADGGSLEDPAQLYSTTVPGVTIGHSAGFTWDGEVLIFGHEPGGGAGARCQATSSITDRTLFFFDADTGAALGTIVHPRPQTATENCTWHNYNVVPTGKRYVLVSGNYQSGISVVDFSDPANAREIAYADPAPLSETQLILGGDWSSYWYDGRIYESDITRGLLVWELSDPATAGAGRLGHLNPQTQESTIG